MDLRVTPDEGHLSVMGLGVRQREEHSSSLGRVLRGLLHTRPSPLGHVPPFPRVLPFGLLSWVCHRGPAVGVTGYPSKLSRAEKKKQKQLSRPPPLTPVFPTAPKGLRPLQAQHPCAAHPPPRVPPSLPHMGTGGPRVLGTGLQGSRPGPRLASCLSTMLKGRAGWS